MPSIVAKMLVILILATIIHKIFETNSSFHVVHKLVYFHSFGRQIYQKWSPQQLTRLLNLVDK